MQNCNTLDSSVKDDISSNAPEILKQELITDVSTRITESVLIENEEDNNQEKKRIYLMLNGLRNIVKDYFLFYLLLCWSIIKVKLKLSIRL